MSEQKKGHGGHAGWPSVERQLSELKVKPGSALEQLIRDNQNPEMIPAEEAHDGLGFPLWLRVYWRKKHPELTEQQIAYPLFLKEALEWAERNQDLPSREPSPDFLKDPSRRGSDAGG